MHSVLTRGNAILAYTLSVSACLTFCCFLSTVFIDYRTRANLNTVKVVVLENGKELFDSEFNFLPDSARWSATHKTGCIPIVWHKHIILGDRRLIIVAIAIRARSGRKNVPDYSASRERNDLGFLTFDLQTDLTPLFNWNVKQLFLYLTAEYQTVNNEINQVVLWDKIVLRGDNAVLDLKNTNTKYYFWDDGNGLRGNKNVTLTLSWNIIPNAGLLPSVSAHGSHSFAFPSEYTTSRV